MPKIAATDRNRVVLLIDRASEKMQGQNALARQIGYSPQELSNWRVGRASCPIEAQVLMAEAAGLDPNEVAAYALVDMQANPERKQRLARALGKAWAHFGEAASWLMPGALALAWVGSDFTRCILC
jgi:DNA-binding transcriptional regulator YdaS (Cro superfamily)